uniref:Putative chaperone n=1 Tax=viral metagenome TaxID=1070528 RepID=A0A6M3IMV2_9ZZZZ
MTQEIVIKEKCSTCNGTGQQPLPSPDEPISCFMCGGTGYRLVATVFPNEDLATKANLQTMYDAIKADLDIIKNGLQTIWDRVKDL